MGDAANNVMDFGENFDDVTSGTVTFQNVYSKLWEVNASLMCKLQQNFRETQRELEAANRSLSGATLPPRYRECWDEEVQPSVEVLQLRSSAMANQCAMPERGVEREHSYENHLASEKLATKNGYHWIVDLYLFSSLDPDYKEPYVGIYLFMANCGDTYMKPDKIMFSFSLLYENKWAYSINQSQFEQNGQLWGCKTFIPVSLLLDENIGFIRKNGCLPMDFKFSVEDKSIPHLDDMRTRFDFKFLVKNITIQTCRSELSEKCENFKDLMENVKSSEHTFTDISVPMAVDMMKIIYTSHYPQIKDQAYIMLTSRSDADLFAKVVITLQTTMENWKMAALPFAPDVVIIAHYLKAEHVIIDCGKLITKDRTYSQIWTNLVHRYNLSHLFCRPNRSRPGQNGRFIQNRYPARRPTINQQYQN